MNDSPPSRTPDPDVEIEALLSFDPVLRHTRRHDGWSPARQYGFIAALARLGDVDRAAHSVGRTASGAWKVRTSAGAEGFSDAWDGALDLFHARNPGLKRRGGRARGPWVPPEPELEPEPEGDLTEAEEARWKELSETILMKYLLKLDAEREARLQGEIVVADFYVRQLTWLEVAIDLAGVGPRAVEYLKGLKRGGRHAGDIVATPMSNLLAKLRRLYWEGCDEPERPEPAALGRHDDEIATGQPPECQHWPERDGPLFGSRAPHDEHLRRNAEAQRAWEEKASADAAAWRARLEAEGRLPEDWEEEPQA
ncbi:MAG: hypothetical protein QOH04_1517 [Sphingomonadales bacterium]|jgi:hypothetical protein|nr:hypothetical protein [Sphingomonadales bacterium]